MSDRNWNDIGNEIKDVVQDAVNSGDFKQLNLTVSKTINDAVNVVSDGIREAGITFGTSATTWQNTTTAYMKQQEEQKRAKQQKQELKVYMQDRYYIKTTGKRVGTLILAGTGFTVSAVLTVCGLILLGIGNLFGMSLGAGVLGVLAVCFASMGVCATAATGKYKRYEGYVRVIDQRTYADISELARKIGKTQKYVKKDLRYMISNGWFKEGNIDAQETCLIISNETYRQYEETIRNKQIQQIADKQREQEPEVQKVIEQGKEYIRKLRKSNEAIDGTEISNKIYRIEVLTQKIFQRVEEHPETIRDIRQLMEYYLPTTIKLLDAYESLDRQPVQGENIQSSKQEIEATLDTLNLAFEKLLDSLFKDIAWDVSSDISVLNTMLAQDGLTKRDFEKLEKK